MILADGVIPIFFLSSKLYETVVNNSNPSHGAFSILFLILSVYSCTIQKTKTFFVTLLFFSILTTFSGFGLLLIPTLIFYSVLRLIAFIKEFSMTNWYKNAYLKELLILFFVIAGNLAVFLHKYTFYFDISCSESSNYQKIEYMSYLTTSIFGFTEPGFAAFITGLLFLLFLTFLVLKMARYISCHKQISAVNKVSFQLLVFSLLFIFFAAIGRICLGMETAFAGRYIPYIIPAILACYLLLRRSSKSYWFMGFVLLLLVIEVISHDHWMRGIEYVTNEKKQMLDCTNGDLNKVIKCEELTQIPIYYDKVKLKEIIQIINK